MERSAWDRDDDEKSGRTCGMRKRRSWLLLLVIVGVVAGVAVGAGVGVSLSQKNKAVDADSRFVLHPFHIYTHIFILSKEEGY